MSNEIPKKDAPEQVQVYVGTATALQEYFAEQGIQPLEHPHMLVTDMDGTIDIEPDTEISDQMILLYNANTFVVQKLRNQGFHIMGKEQS